MIFSSDLLKRPVIILVACNAIALLLLILVVFWPLKVPVYKSGQDVSVPSTPASFLEGSLQKTSLTSLLERPIFHSGRRAILPPPPKIEETPVVVDTSTGLEGIRLIGIVQSGMNQGWAYLYSSRDNKRIKLKQGEDFNGWRLSEVSSDKVRLIKNNKVAVMEQKNGGNPQYGSL